MHDCRFCSAAELTMYCTVS